MSKSNQMFQEEQERIATDFGTQLNAEYLEIQKAHSRQIETLNEIFEAWGEIFGTIQKLKSNSENEDQNI
jgi:hypothetical protein|tara:strand:+ start:1375 stop:1584 length:210 start_codon:yes stop_codon:yes gene_type:complete